MVSPNLLCQLYHSMLVITQGFLLGSSTSSCLITISFHLCTNRKQHSMLVHLKSNRQSINFLALILIWLEFVGLLKDPFPLPANHILCCQNYNTLATIQTCSSQAQVNYKPQHLFMSSRERNDLATDALCGYLTLPYLTSPSRYLP